MVFLSGGTFLPVNTEQLLVDGTLIAVLTEKELAAGALSGVVTLPPLPDGRNSRFCKAEVHESCAMGTLCIPVREPHPRRASFTFYMSAKLLLFVDDSGLAFTLVKKAAQTNSGQSIGLGRFFCEFLEELIAEDILYIEELEKRISKMEDSILSVASDQFTHKMMALRKELMTLAHYYSQLQDMSDEIQECGFFSDGELRIFALLSARITRLHSETQMLREYSMQVREVFQAQIGIHQNKIMRILTVITAIFMPLTLLVGWYGMNFKFMPELSWPLAYPIIILISVAIVALCIYWLKKKKFW